MNYPSIFHISTSSPWLRPFQNDFPLGPPRRKELSTRQQKGCKGLATKIRPELGPETSWDPGSNEGNPQYLGLSENRDIMGMESIETIYGLYDDIWWYLGLSENVVYPIVPNGFADHYPVFKWLFHWEYTQHFQTNPFEDIWTSWKCKLFFAGNIWNIIYNL